MRKIKKYYFKAELKDEFLDGRTQNYVCQKLGCTNAWLNFILSGKKSCSKILATALIALLKPKDNLKKYFTIV